MSSADKIASSTIITNAPKVLTNGPSTYKRWYTVAILIGLVVGGGCITFGTLGLLESSHLLHLSEGFSHMVKQIGDPALWAVASIGGSSGVALIFFGSYKHSRSRHPIDKNPASSRSSRRSSKINIDSPKNTSAASTNIPSTIGQLTPLPGEVTEIEEMLKDFKTHLDDFPQIPAREKGWFIQYGINTNPGHYQINLGTIPAAGGELTAFKLMIIKDKNGQVWFSQPLLYKTLDEANEFFRRWEIILAKHGYLYMISYFGP